MRRSFRILPLFGALALGGCMTTASAPQRSNLASQDLAFVTTAYQLVHFDLNACSIVQKNEIEPGAKAAIDKVCADAARYQPQLRTLAAREGVKLPNTLPFDMKEKLVSLNYHPDPNLTVAFLRDEISSHESAVAVFQGEVRDGKNSQFRETARQALPVVQENLKMLRQALPNGMTQ